MIVWGGLADEAGSSYDPIADSWTPISRVNEPSMRGQHTAIWTGSRMIVWGGVNTSFPDKNQCSCEGADLGDGASYNPATDKWTTIAPGGPTGRSGHSAVWTGSRMIIWGGTHQIWSSSSPGVPDSCGVGYYNSGSVYNPATDTWSPTTRPAHRRRTPTTRRSGRVHG